MMIEKAVVDFFEKIPFVVCVFLFGSYAQNTQTKKSDVDLAILCDKAHVPDALLLIDWREEISHRIQRDVDLVCLNTASPIIGMQVYNHGRLLIAKDLKQYADYQMYLFVSYAELKEMRKPMEQDILKRKLYD